MDLIDAIKYCREWFPQRKWLLKNNVNIVDFPEEIKFQDYTSKHKMYETAYKNRLKNALSFVAKEKAIKSGVQKKMLKVNKLHIQNDQNLSTNGINLSNNVENEFIVNNHPDRLVTFEAEDVILDKKQTFEQNKQIINTLEPNLDSRNKN